MQVSVSHVNGTRQIPNEDLTCGICLEEAKRAVHTRCCKNVLCEGDARQLRKCPYCRAEPLKVRAQRGLMKLVNEDNSHRIHVAVRIRPPTSDPCTSLKSGKYCVNCKIGKDGTRNLSSTTFLPGDKVLVRKTARKQRDLIDEAIDPSGEYIRAPTPDLALVWHTGVVIRDSELSNKKIIKFTMIRNTLLVPQYEEEVFENELIRRCGNTTSDRPLHKIRTQVTLKSPSRETSYLCDDVFDRNSCQDDIYQSFGRMLVDDFSGGSSCCLFAYGMTGSGKTHSMMGSSHNPGLIPQVCHALLGDSSPYNIFRCLTRHSDEKGSPARVVAEYFEIYCEKVKDLLVENSNHVAMQVQQTPTGQTFFNEISKFEIETYDQLISLVSEGNTRRSCASTKLNEVSSRAHTVLTLTVVSESSGWYNKLHLVDLAGSEPAAVLHGSGKGPSTQRFQEGRSVNLSLLSLGRVIHMLANENKSTVGDKFVPARESLLTCFLQDSLGGGSRTYVLATVNPSAEFCHFTGNTLRFAHNAMHVRGRDPIERCGITAYEAMLKKILRRITTHHELSKDKEQRTLYPKKGTSIGKLAMIKFNPAAWRAFREAATTHLPDTEEVNEKLRFKELPSADHADLYLKLQLAELCRLKALIIKFSSCSELADITVKYPLVFTNDDVVERQRRDLPRTRSSSHSRSQNSSQRPRQVSRQISSVGFMSRDQRVRSLPF